MNFQKGQMVHIVAGKYAGKTAWFHTVSKRPGGEHCFVQFKTPNISFTQVRLDEIEAVD